MDASRRLIACMLVVVAALGLCPLRALAQQPTVVEVMPAEPPPARSTDIYDVGAGVVTAARMPFNVVLCGLGAAAGTALFFLTFGSAYKASTRAVEEGCAQPWIVRGDDLRPRGAPGAFSRGATDTPSGRW